MALTYHLIDAYHDRYIQELWSFGLDEYSQGLRLASQPTGLDGAPFKHMRQKNARQAGASWVGADRDVNSITLDVHVGPYDSAEDAIDAHARWRNTVGDGAKVSEFHVIDQDEPNPLHVWLPVRMTRIAAENVQVQLADDWYAREQVTFESDTSYWQGYAQWADFRPGDMPTASLPNLSDVPVYPLYRVSGPGTFTVGTPTEFHTLPTLTETQLLEINTDPDNAYIRDENGNDAWDRVGVKAWYEPIDVRGDVPFKLSVTGDGGHWRTSVRVELPQLFSRAGHVPLPQFIGEGGPK